MNKTEIVQWLVGHIFDASPTNPDFSMVDLWTLLSTLIEYMKEEESESMRGRVMYNIRRLIKGVIGAESP